MIHRDHNISPLREVQLATTLHLYVKFLHLYVKLMGCGMTKQATLILMRKGFLALEGAEIHSYYMFLSVSSLNEL